MDWMGWMGLTVHELEPCPFPNTERYKRSVSGKDWGAEKVKTFNFPASPFLYQVCFQSKASLPRGNAILGFLSILIFVPLRHQSFPLLWIHPPPLKLQMFQPHSLALWLSWEFRQSALYFIYHTVQCSKWFKDCFPYIQHYELLLRG